MSRKQGGTDGEPFIFSRRVEISAACLAIAAALIFQFRPLFWHFPPPWSAVAATGASWDYLHLIPVQIHTLNPRLYAHDYVIAQVTPLYPWLWRKASGIWSLLICRDALLGNWILSCLALLAAASGIAILGYAATGNFLTAGLAVFFLLAGRTDPTQQYFIAMGDLAVPHEQALSLFPWILLFPVLRAKGRKILPWELLILGLAANIHAPTAVYVSLALCSAYLFVPECRPSLGAGAILTATFGMGMVLTGIVPSLACLSSWKPPSAGFFSWAYWFLYPVSNLSPAFLRIMATTLFLSRWPLVLFGFWILARPWLKIRGNAANQVLFTASAPLTVLSLGRLLVLILPFSPALIMGEFRAFMPAIVPLIPLASDFWRPLEKRKRNLLILILGFFLLLRSSAKDNWGTPKSRGPWGSSVMDAAFHAREMVPQDSLVLVPMQLVAFRALSQRAAFGDFRGIEMLLSFDKKIEDFYWPECLKLNSAYRHRNWPRLESVAADLHADYAILPAAWNPCLDSKSSNCLKLYTNSDLSIVKINSRKPMGKNKRDGG